MRRSDTTSPAARLFALVAMIVAVVALYFGHEVLIPLALAILFTFLLTPPVRWLERLHLPRVAAVLLVTALAFAIIIAIGYVLAGQVVELAGRLPQYRNAIHERSVAVRQAAGGILTGFDRNFSEISQEIATQPTSQPTPSQAPAASAPTPVRIVGGTGSSLQMAGTALSSLLHPLLTGSLTVIFVIFILIQQEDLRDRLIRLTGQDRIDVTTQAFDDTAQRIGRYLIRQATINTAFGLLAALGLWLIGLPNAFLWGFLCGALRFIPYIGVWIGMLVPLALSLAVWSHGWGRPLAVAGLLAGLELVTANVAEPLLYSSSTGISPLAVLVAAVFWSWLWGPVGLLLSTPLTVCLAVIGKYVPMLSFLSILLSDEPVLDPPVRFYQRLLAGDRQEAQDIAESLLKETSLCEAYDHVLIPALHLAETDRHRGRLDEARIQAVFDGMQDTIDHLIARDEAPGRQREQIIPPKTTAREMIKAAAATESSPAESPRHIQVLCLPARDQADQIIAMMLAQVLTSTGTPALSVPTSMLVSEMLEAVQGSGARVVCISALPPASMTKARHLCKRLETRLAGLKVIVGLWDASGDIPRARTRLLTAGADHVVTSLSAVQRILQPTLATKPTAAP